MIYPKSRDAASGGTMSVVIEDGQKIRVAWAAYFREIQEELAEASAILDNARTTLQPVKGDNGGDR